MAVSRINEAGLNVNQYGNRNLIINGAMEVAQRGTSSTSNGYHTVDRWSVLYTGTDEAPTQEQVDVASGTTPYTSGFRKAYKITNGNQTSGAGAGDYVGIYYYMEGQDISSSGWNTTDPNSKITISYWVKSSVAQTFYAKARAYASSQYEYTYSIALSADTWTKVTETMPGNSNFSSLLNTNAAGFNHVVMLFFGTNYTNNKTLGEWAVKDNANKSPDMTSTWYTTNDATFEITGVQLEVGDTATDFEHRSYGDELARCKRYFESKSFTTFVEIGYSNGTTSAHCILPFLEKRAAPTVTLPTAGQSTNELTFRTPTGANPSTTGSNSVYDLTTTQGRIQGASYSGLTAGGVSSLYLNGTASITFDAEL